MIAPFNADVQPQRLSPDGPLAFTFENINESSLSRFLRFDIYHGKELVRPPFLVKIDVKGLPETRVSTILKAIISDRDKILRVLRFLLPTSSTKEMLPKRTTQAPILGTRSKAMASGARMPPSLRSFLSGVTASGALKEINDVIKDSCWNRGEGERKEESSDRKS